MKKGELSTKLGTEDFRYKETHRFNENNFILAVRDRESTTNIISILYYDNGKISDIDEYGMGDKIRTSPNSHMPDIPSLNKRFLVNQLVKVSFGGMVENPHYQEPDNKAKYKTFHTYVNPLKDKEVIEIFEGKIIEASSTFYPKEERLGYVIKEVYIPSSNVFFVLEDNKLQGPFKAVKVDTSGAFIVEKNQWRKFGFYEFNEDTFVEFEANGIQRRIIIPRVGAELKFIQEADFVSDADLLNRFKQQFGTDPEDFDSTTLNKFLEFIERWRTNPVSFHGESARNKERMLALLESNKEKILESVNIITKIPEVAGIRDEIIKLEKELLKAKEEKRRIEEEKRRIEEEIEKDIQKKEDLNSEIANRNSKKEEDLKAQKSALDNKIKQLEIRKNEIDAEIEKEKESKSNELRELEKEISKRKIIESDLGNTILNLKKNFSKQQIDAQEQLNELIKQKTYFDFISGRDLSKRDGIEETEFRSFEILKGEYSGTEEKLDRYTAFKDEVASRLGANNRQFDSHFIDNILISIHQNTLTLFVGLPGTGKTSLVRILTNNLTPKERIREVAVARGWSSQKDLIGFFNPLNKSFHSSSTNLYSLIKQLDWEREKELYLNSPMSYVLLDEANLSPMEYYWSTFYNLTDSICKKPDSFLEFNLGSSEKIRYANNLRFIGTINYDQTTEELSPRVIDRANIIRIEPKPFEIDRISNSDIINLSLSYQDCIDYFGLLDFSKEQHRSISFDNKEMENSFNEIRNSFKELKIVVSPRVEIAIKRYCSVAKGYMYEQNKPLDYCIAQRLLPLIRVRGVVAEQKLNDLLDKINKYDISSKILSGIIQAGSSETGVFQGDFNYFSALSNV